MELRKTMQITLRDYLDFNYHFIRKRLIITPVLAAIIVTFFVSIIGIINLGRDWTFVFDSSLIFYYAMVVLLPVLSIIAVRSAAKKQYESSKAMKSEIEIVLNEMGVSDSCKYGNTSMEWADLYKVAESKNAFYFYIAKSQAYILPKRMLVNEEDGTVRTLITKYMAPNKYRFLKQR